MAKEEERSYVVPLRKGWMKSPEYKRASKAVKTLKSFISKHMKVPVQNVKLDDLVNRFLWKDGIKHPPAKVMVNVKRETKDKKTVVIVKLESPDKEKIKSRIKKPVFVRTTKKPKKTKKPEGKKEEVKKQEEKTEGKKEEKQEKKPEKKQEKEKTEHKEEKTSVIKTQK